MRKGIIVQKFGGTSVGSIERMHTVAEHIIRAYRRGKRVIVVVSAMAGETDRLVSKARSIVGEEIYPDELDVLLSTGEQVSTSLLSMILRKKGVPARSMQGHQIRIITDRNFSNARIIKVEKEKLRYLLSQGIVPVVAGFQGVTEDGEITTLGRGGSDTTAVAVAVAMRAELCEIYTDVRGVFSTDPAVVPSASKISFISYEEMMELASVGAKVLQIRSVEIASRFKMPIHVRSTFEEGMGTIVAKNPKAAMKCLEFLEA